MFTLSRGPTYTSGNPVIWTKLSAPTPASWLSRLFLPNTKTTVRTTKTDLLLQPACICLTVHVFTVFFLFFFLAAILVFCRARAAVSPHLTLPHTGTNTVSTGRQRNIPTDKSLHTHTVWLEGSFLTSKLFLSRSDAHRLVLFGCVG